MRQLKFNPLKWYRRLYKGKWYKKILVGIASFFVFAILLLVAVDQNFLWLFGPSPSTDEIEHGTQAEASIIYSADGKVIGKFFSENRTSVKYEDISPILIKTLVATEDERFYSHHGIDFQGLGAALKDMIFNSKKRGASTITQQLVKNMYKTRTSKYSLGLLGKIPCLRMAILKLKEWVIAFRIESKFSKEEILTMYFNTVDFGSNAFGINTAARTYFNASPKNLTYEQSAVLIGLLKATTTYNPRLNPSNALKRRNTVLQNMVRNNYLSQHDCDSISQIPIKLDCYIEDNYSGMALHFRDQLNDYLKDWLKENDRNLYTDGLKIYVTIDSSMQAYAQQAAMEHMESLQDSFYRHWKYSGNPWCDMYHKEIPNFIENIAYKTKQFECQLKENNNDTAKALAAMDVPHKLQVFDYKLGSKDTVMSSLDSIRYMVKFLHCAFVAIEPDTRHVKAWVGDLDFKFWKYDKVTAMRQPGSTFKIFDYTEAMNQGMSPCDEEYDRYIAWPVWDKGKRKQWVPHNADGICLDTTFSLRAAFARSINTVAVRISKKVGIENICKTAYAMGITHPLCDTMPATCLGGSDVTLLDLTNSYCTVMADGICKSPILVTKIEDKEGNVIYTEPDHEIQAIPYSSAFLMQTMLHGALSEYHCTSGYVIKYVRQWWATTDFGGKTGTSNNHSDGWFMGVTPGLVGGAWVGGEYRSIHFRGGDIAGGNFTALPIYGKFMNKVLSDSSMARYQKKLSKPKEKIDRCYNCRPYNYDDLRDSIAMARELVSQ